MSPRSSQRVDRRRRVLADESRNDEVTTPRIFHVDSHGPTHRYSESALKAINAPIAKYIPLRPFYLLVWFLVGLIPILGLLVLDQYRPEIANVVGSKATHAFDLNANGNLMDWFSTVAYGFAVAVMLGIYSVRRHRRDDYRGRFTIWRWAIACAALLSVDATVGLHHVWQGLCEYVAKTPLWGDGSIWWVGTWALVFGVMLVRLAMEMSSSRIAVASAVGAACCYAWASLVELNAAPATWVAAESPLAARASQLTTLMFGHHLILFSLVSYAREVVLEAMGLVESPIVRRAKAQAARAERQSAKQAKRDEQSQQKSVKKKASKKKAGEVAAKKTAAKATTQKKADTEEKKDEGKSAPQLRAVTPELSDGEDTTPAPTPTKKSNKPKLKLAASTSEEDYEEAPKLSKAEKRRLRKEQKRQQRRAA